MKFNRLWWLCAFSFAVCQCEDVHSNVPRWLRIFSKGPELEDERYEGKNVLHHIDNALKGGIIGLQVDMKKQLGKLSKLWAKLKDSIQKYKNARSSLQPEDRELEGFLPDGVDPRRPKWPPSRLVASDRIDSGPDFLLLDSRLDHNKIPKHDSEVDPDSELLDGA